MALFPWSKTNGSSSPPDERSHILALINEVWMLVDYIAGRSDQALKKVEVQKPGGGNYTPMELLAEVSSINTRLSATTNPPPVATSQDRALMQVIRDALNAAIYPASGLSVAYSTMVAGPLRRRSASRFALARQAYENLTMRAYGHRWLSIAILSFSIFATGIAVWESAKVALGKALLQNLDTLRTQQSTLSAEKVKLDLTFATAAATKQKLDALLQGQNVPISAYGLCDRALVLFALSKNADPQAFAADSTKDPGPRMLFYNSAEERDVCGRDDILRANLGIVHQGLLTYSQNWPGMVGSVFATVRNLALCFRFSCPASNGAAAIGKQDDIEFNIAPLLLVWGNLVLPIIFSFIGSAIFVTRDHYTKVRDSLLQPRDFFLAPVRLALGLVVGACVGLFFSAYGPVPPNQVANSASALISSLTLTASGVAFLAGFGVEAVFSLLEGLINRVFKDAETPQRGPL